MKCVEVKLLAVDDCLQFFLNPFVGEVEFLEYVVLMTSMGGSGGTHNCCVSR